MRKPSIVNVMTAIPLASAVTTNEFGLDSQGFGHGFAYPDKRTHATKERNRARNEKAQKAAKKRKKK